MMRKPIKEAETSCMYCKVDGVCPACDGEGCIGILNNTPPYESLATCEDCNGSGLCPVCRYHNLPLSRKALDRKNDGK